MKKLALATALLLAAFASKATAMSVEILPAPIECISLKDGQTVFIIKKTTDTRGAIRFYALQGGTGHPIGWFNNDRLICKEPSD